MQKSTTMNCHDRLSGATEGTGADRWTRHFKGPGRSQRRISVICLRKFPPLYIQMTVREYLEFGPAELKELKDKEPQIEEVIRLAKREETLKNKLIQNLSKGYKPESDLHRQFWDSEIIILDEPTVGLDRSRSSKS